jgi:septal ring factor EnvC (AmiA/AmiB activator)
MEIELAIGYHDSKQRLQRMLQYLKEDLQKYRLSENAKPEYIKKQQRIIEVVEQYSNDSDCIIKNKQYIIYYTHEHLKDERHMLYQNKERNHQDLKRHASELAQQNAALKRTIEKLRGCNY